MTATGTTNGNPPGPTGPDCDPDGTCGFNIPSGTPLTAVGTVQYVADNDDVSSGAWVALARVNNGISHTVGIHTAASAQNPAATVALFPSLSITKECTTPDIFVGEDAVYEIVVTNTSTPDDLVSFTNVTVSDTLSGTLNPPGAFNLDPQASQNLTLTQHHGPG